MFPDEIPYDKEADKNLGNVEKDQTNQLEEEGKSLPEDIEGFIQKVRDELKTYEECKSFYEKQRKREIILELVDLLVTYDYPKEWFRVIIARKLGDYISTRYIEIILAEKYPNEKKKVKKKSTSQIAKISRIEDKTPIELSTTGDSIVSNVDCELRNPNLYNSDQKSTSTKVSSQFRTELERQAEEGVQIMVKKLQEKVKGLETKCYQLDQLAQERLMWEKRYNQLYQEFDIYRKKGIKGIAQIEFGSEFIPVKIEYNFTTNQFSANIPQEVIERIIGALRRK
jgi:hypothetical protein